MKLNHNKKRNTAFTYEVLIKELSKASMHEQNERKNNIIKILKEFFSAGRPLKKELEIYNSFNELGDTDKDTIQKIIAESRRQAAQLDTALIYETQTRMINTINKVVGRSCWDNFVKDYKKMATINQAVFRDLSPKKKVFVESKLVDLVSRKKEEKKPFPTINKLAMKTFLDKFNQEYTSALNENQKTLLNKYIVSYRDNGLELKMYLHEEIGRLKHQLQDYLSAAESPNPKIGMILEKIEGYKNKTADKKFVTEIIKIQALVEKATHAESN